MTTSHTDTRLRWTMRIVGSLLGIACIFLLTTDVVRTDEAIAFLVIGSGLGLVTFVTSWLSVPSRTAPEAARS